MSAQRQEQVLQQSVSDGERRETSDRLKNQASFVYGRCDGLKKCPESIAII